MKIKTIDITAKEWFDRVNGNSYFSAIVTLNYGMKNSKSIALPFQYGYDDHYKTVALEEMQKQKLITKTNNPLWRFCGENNIILRCYKQENCKKREVVLFTQE